MKTKVKFFDPLPKERGIEYKTPNSAGFDLIACNKEPVIIKVKGFAKIPLGVGLQPEDKDVLIQIRSRSSLMSQGIFCGHGTIDADYTGEFAVIMYNLSDEDFTVNRGDRVAQAVCHKFVTCEFSEEEFEKTERGSGGFGSTGI